MVGFYAKNKHDVDQVNRCGLCSLILREPVQLFCGHRQCRSCVECLTGETIKCPVCQEECSRTDVVLDKGFKKDMQKLGIDCSLCPWNGLLKDYEDHLNAFHQNPECEYCGKNFTSANSLDFHKLNECDKITVPCALKDYGCSCAVVLAQMSNHYTSVEHQCAIVAFIRRLTYKSSVDPHERDSKMDIDTLPHINTTTRASFSETTTSHFQEVSETVDILAGGLQALNGDTQRLNQSSSELNNEIDALEKNLVTLNLSMEEQTAFIDRLQPNQEVQSQDMIFIKQKIEDIQKVAHDGTLIWKIENFKDKFDAAQSERQASIYSPPFYSSPTGYKMRARLYLNGDGNARGTHMSLFFVLMRSDYDGILTFPFKFKVTFCLYDQTPKQQHIINSFRPDVRSKSFERPKSDMNIAYGIPEFAVLSKFEKEGNPYVWDDTMFIKVMVEFDDVPETLLPYALCLNPALPASIQHIMLKQETERRTQQTSTLPTAPTPEQKSA